MYNKNVREGSLNHVLFVHVCAREYDTHAHTQRTRDNAPLCPLHRANETKTFTRAKRLKDVLS